MMGVRHPVLSQRRECVHSRARIDALPICVCPAVMRHAVTVKHCVAASTDREYHMYPLTVASVWIALSREVHIVADAV